MARAGVDTDVALALLLWACMSFSHAVDRMRAHFDEMPGLELTVAQTVRLVGFGVDDCRYVIDALVDAGFCGGRRGGRSSARTVCGRAFRRRPTFLSDGVVSATEPSIQSNQ